MKRAVILPPHTMAPPNLSEVLATSNERKARTWAAKWVEQGNSFVHEKGYGWCPTGRNGGDYSEYWRVYLVNAEPHPIYGEESP